HVSHVSFSQNPKVMTPSLGAQFWAGPLGTHFPPLYSFAQNSRALATPNSCPLPFRDADILPFPRNPRNPTFPKLPFPRTM
uniref:Uncharacterized protein n=1 Tax=Chlorocebus sabaeus TaxID=60711 RepID=A0A0D9S5H4_CHLSB